MLSEIECLVRQWCMPGVWENRHFEDFQVSAVLPDEGHPASWVSRPRFISAEVTLGDESLTGRWPDDQMPNHLRNGWIPGVGSGRGDASIAPRKRVPRWKTHGDCGLRFASLCIALHRFASLCCFFSSFFLFFCIPCRDLFRASRMLQPSHLKSGGLRIWNNSEHLLIFDQTGYDRGGSRSKGWV